MSKYGVAKQAIEFALAQSQHLGLEQGEIISALIVSATNEYQQLVGKDETRVLLTYELDNLGGTLDMVNLRAR